MANKRLLGYTEIADAKQRATFKRYPWNDLGVTASDCEITEAQDRETLKAVGEKLSQITKESGNLGEFARRVNDLAVSLKEGKLT